MKRTFTVEYYLAGIIALITFIAYIPALQNGFVNLDDEAYIVKNPHIRSLGPAFFRWAFLHFSLANWHPLTWMSHALDYALWGLNPLGHHLMNIALHALNTFLVVLLVIRLLNSFRERTPENRPSPFLHERSVLVAAGVTGTLFGLHPVHVESVAWVAERKDVLYALFFLISIITYTDYVKRANEVAVRKNLLSRFFNKYYLLTAGFFILALLSKPMAVTLPAVLLILDWHPFDRIRSLRTLSAAVFEKLPLVVLSFFSSVITVLAQRTGGAMAMTDVVPLSIRLLVACQSLIVYLGKMIWPVNLYPFYSYPRDASFVSPEYLFEIALLVAITTACVITVKRQKLWLSAWGYYIATLLPVLGIIQVGGQAMADRYTYLPSLGPFLITGLGAARISEKMKTLKRGAQGLMMGFAAAIAAFLFVFLLFSTYKQIKVWTDSLQLWDYTLEKNNYQDPVSYLSRGHAFDNMGRLDKALEDYSRAIALSPTLTKAYYNRAIIFDKLGQSDRAFADYSRVLNLDPNFYGAYINRGLFFFSRGQLDSAIADFDRAAALKPEEPEAFYNQGLVFYQMGRLDQALADFDKAVSLSPADADVYNIRGQIYSRLGQLDRAIADFDRAISLNPAYSEAYYNRGLAFQKAGQPDRAKEDFTAWKTYSAKH